jgi:hypothetical protein
MPPPGSTIRGRVSHVGAGLRSLPRSLSRSDLIDALGQALEPRSQIAQMLFDRGRRSEPFSAGCPRFGEMPIRSC